MADKETKKPLSVEQAHTLLAKRRLQGVEQEVAPSSTKWGFKRILDTVLSGLLIVSSVFGALSFFLPPFISVSVWQLLFTLAVLLAMFRGGLALWKSR